MQRFFLAVAALGLMVLATGCCCGGGYGACRPACGPCGTAAMPSYAPVAQASPGCASCNAY